MKRETLLKLRPTQMAFGLKEACDKADSLLKMKSKKRKAHIAENPIEIIIGPDGCSYIIDHHHLAYALLLLGYRKVPVKIRANLSGRRLSRAIFFKIMKRRSWIHLYDQMGCGPHKAIYLATDIRGLADDPYRSLVWAVKHEGGIGESKKKFYEFDWAQFLRKRNLLKDRSRSEFKRAVKQAKKLCLSPAAKGLTGFVG